MRATAVALLCAYGVVGVNGAKRKAALPDPNCKVTAIYEDGREEERDCYSVTAEDSKPATKGRFESCTQ